MSTWLQAHRIANLAAAQAHSDLCVDPAKFPIDVYAAIATASVVLMWRPLPRAFGMYINSPGSRPGILLNNRLDLAVQRHTAAHELGHHYLAHGRRVDFDLDPFDSPRRGWTDTEKAAEAFAVWFLMPRRAVRAALDLLGMDRPREPEQVYQLSLLLRTSYRSTVRHLVNLHVASNQQASIWMKIQPNRIKQRLDCAQRPESRAPDVWKINRRFAGSTLKAGVGDRFVIDPDGALRTLRLTGDFAVMPSLHRRADGEVSVVDFIVVEVSETANGLAKIGIGPLGHPASWEFQAQIERRCSGVAGMYQNAQERSASDDMGETRS